MHHGASFAEVLDATLRGFQPAAAARRPGPQIRPLPPNPFLFTFKGPIAADLSQPPDLPRRARIEVSFGAAAPVSTGVHQSAPPPREERARPAAAAPPVDGSRATMPSPEAEAPVRPPAINLRPRRRLTRAQERSLAAFVDAGAPIGPDFSAEELRSAFRRLARRYHPDRHPLASDADKATLSRQFAAVTADYEVLLTALDASRI